jgi:hypothetical protein
MPFAQRSDDRCAFRSLRFTRHRRSRRRIPSNNCSLALCNRWGSRFSYDRLDNISYATAAAVAALYCFPFQKCARDFLVLKKKNKKTYRSKIHLSLSTLNLMAYE